MKIPWVLTCRQNAQDVISKRATSPIFIVQTDVTEITYNVSLYMCENKANISQFDKSDCKCICCYHINMFPLFLS